jgi:SpoVK/Ycf46/Vps4 family AAA+-type ATPase
MLGRRENPGEHEAMRKMKNEFMVNWDGLRTKEKERVLVLAATNRPFDLDEAVVRRLPRRCDYHVLFMYSNTNTKYKIYIHCKFLLVKLFLG